MLGWENNYAHKICNNERVCLVFWYLKLFCICCFRNLVLFCLKTFNFEQKLLYIERKSRLKINRVYDKSYGSRGIPFESWNLSSAPCESIHQQTTGCFALDQREADAYSVSDCFPTLGRSPCLTRCVRIYWPVRCDLSMLYCRSGPS